MSASTRPHRIWLLAALLAACEHGAPFRPEDYAPDRPFAPTAPTRLTFSAGLDLAPAWLPAESGILYTAERLDRADDDRCFAILPAGGGAITRYVCRTTTADDSIDVFDEAAVAADGRIAYVRSSVHRFPEPPLAPDAQALVVAPLASPNDVRVLQAIGYLAPSGRLHQGVSHIRWLSSTRLVYVGEDVTYPRLCPFCARDTLHTGLEVVVLDLAGRTPALTVVPGTDGATSVAADATGDTLYFTLPGDGRVFRFTFSSGQTDVAHDFSPGQDARDVAVAGGRLFVVVDGNVRLGGDLHVLNLATGTETVVPPPSGELLWYQRPAPSPDGGRVVSQARIVSIITRPDGSGVDTLTSSADLWLYQLP